MLLTLPMSAQNVSVEAKIDSTVIFVGQQTGFHLGVTVKEGQKVQFPQFEPLQQIIPGIEVVETLPSDTQKLDDGFVRVSAHYTLTSFDDTLYYIPSVKVKVNGKDCGLVWKQPFRLDITDALREGENKLEVEVTNTWTNRLIGDQQPDCPRKITYTSYPFYNEHSMLRPAGLLGPVAIEVVVTP